MATTSKVGVERRNLSPAALYEHAIRRNEAAIVSTGALTAETGRHTGRSPKDKFFVKEPTSKGAIWWEANQGIAPARVDGLLERMDQFCATHEVFTQDVFACADHRHRLRVRVVTEYAWHSLFARNLFIRPNADELMNFEPDFTVISLPSVKADPKVDGTRRLRDTVEAPSTSRTRAAMRPGRRVARSRPHEDTRAELDLSFTPAQKLTCRRPWRNLGFSEMPPFG